MASQTGPRTRPVALWALLLSVQCAMAQDSSPTGPTMPGIAWDCNAFHTVVSGDSCFSIQQEFHITSQQFLAWNPALSSDCLTNFWLSYAYCVGINPNLTSTTSAATITPISIEISSSYGSSSDTSTKSGSASTGSQAKTTTSLYSTPYSTRHPITSYNLTAPYTATSLPPAHTLAGQPSYCNAWHWVATGDTCEIIVNLYGNRLTRAQLLEYNPTLGNDCSGLYYGWYICVGIQSQTSVTLSWSTSATNATVPSPTIYTPPISTVVADFTASPRQTGIPSTCQNFYQAQSGDTCNTILAQYKYITNDQFFNWNPALASNCQGLLTGYYYCVANFGASDMPMPPTVTASPFPTATGTIRTCISWYLTVVNDDCASIASWFGTFSETDFISWNPSVWSTCANIQEETYYCVGIPGTPTTRTTAQSTTSASSMPTQSGLVANCTRFWLVSSTDTCISIMTSAGISSDEFYAWNPALGANCTDLTPDYYVCVSRTVSTSRTGSVTTITGPVSPTSLPPSITTSRSATTTSGGGSPVTTPSPIMPGMVSGCVRFYYRGNGAAPLYCTDMAANSGISLADFYSWNPGVGSNCASLCVDTWYCIGISGPGTTISTGLSTPVVS